MDIGIKQPTFIIAEAGVNHNGSLEIAKKLVDAAVRAGADAVKFQTFKAKSLVKMSAPKAQYQMNTTDVSESQFEMLKSLELSLQDHLELKEYCKDKNILFLSSPFDLMSVDYLANELDVSIIKVASGELTNPPLLLKIAQTQKPVILSSGMSTLGEIETALSIIAFGYLHPDKQRATLSECHQVFCSPEGQAILKNKVSLLHCTTEYPTPFDEVNLQVIQTLQHAFGLPVGYSDHTKGIAISIAAVARGAQLIEKHFTLDKTMPGPDHQASLEPAELSDLITGIRQVELAIGTHKKIPTSSELKNKEIARKSLVALQPIREGDVFDETNLGVKRPGDGISSIHYWSWLGKTAKMDYQEDDCIEVE